ncbi:TKL protein kinase [Arthroderma uncinatum]|uniref:TKL protein kinase n=1 Tax=Arthroderma uncinatum TaxID=74035 RepID=UPI00144A6D4A|nr:TKL protein kinase [Arthroderma uncinatum]KAF3480570.1 TKL protein kinase [Arthroderma uncinatum]
MAISIADASGPFLCPFFLMPDLKTAPPVRHSLFHRLGLRSWLGRDGEGIGSHSQFVARELSRQRLAGLPRPNEKAMHDDDDINSVASVANSDQFAASLPQPSPSNVSIGLPRAPTFKRQNSERRDHLTPSESGLGHRRAYSADRQGDLGPCRTNSPLPPYSPRLSVPDLPADDHISNLASPTLINEEPSAIQGEPGLELEREREPQPQTDLASEYGAPSEDTIDNDLEAELDKKWILNLSMRFRDKSDREKFFITYAEAPNRWRKVTVSCDYRNAEPESLESDLKKLQYHREKNSHIYESIRESIDEIQFYDTVTNLKLETRDGRLHVHVTEDINEVIIFPPISSVEYLNPLFIPESELDFDSHLSGFVYRVKYHGKDYVKKEITGPDTVEEFLYEINALHALLESNNVINFRAIVVDDTRTLVKGLLIDYAEQGALADLFYDFKGELSWQRRERWAKQIIKGLGDIHEAGFVQGDFTVSNVVVDEHDNAKIIDINRRGCPIGWEPPEFTKKLESKQRISMYIGVKSDLYQLGMTLWGLAMEEDEPGRQPRPLLIPEDMKIPAYFRRIVDICMSERPQGRLSAKDLLALFDDEGEEDLPMLGAEVPRYAPTHGSNGVYRGNGHVNYNYQLNPMYMDQHAKDIHFASLPTSFSNMDDRLRYQPLGMEPVIMAPSRNSPDFHCMNNNLQTAHHHHGEHGIPVSPNGLDQNGQFFPANHWGNGQGPIPYYNPGFVRPALASHNATMGLSEMELLDRQDRETEFDPRFDDLGPTELTGHSRGGYPVDESYVSEIQDHMEPNPPYFMHDRYLAPDQPDTPLDSIPTSEEFGQLQHEYIHENSVDKTVEASPETQTYHQGADESPEYILDSADLSNSRLPINPGFIETPDPNLPDPVEHDHQLTSSPKESLQPSIPPDNLLISALPINPRYDEPESKVMHLNKYADDDLLSSQLPINPAYIDPIDRELPPHEQVNDAVLPISRASTTPQPLLPTHDDLLESTLPINPRHKGQEPESYRRLNTYPDSDTDLLLSNLPINPRFIEPAIPNSSTNSRQVSLETTVLRPLTSPDYPCSTPDDFDLLTSVLPINPRNSTQELSGNGTTETRSDDGQLLPILPIQPTKLPRAQSDSPLTHNDLFTSTLPINPRHKGDDVRQLKNPNPVLDNDELLSPESPGISTPPLEVPLISSNLSPPPPDDLLLSGLPINPRYRNQPLECPAAPKVNSVDIDLLSSKLPINPRYRDQQLECPAVPKMNAADSDLLSSKLPINPAFIHPPSSREEINGSSKIDTVLISTSCAELFMSVLPINPASST